MIGWKAWYTKDRTYNSNSHSWEDLPDDGVIAVIVFGERNLSNGIRYRRIHDGFDWYFRYEDTIISNNLTLQENEKRYPQGYGYKRGKWVSDKKFKIVSEKVNKSRWYDDPDYKDCVDC